MSRIFVAVGIVCFLALLMSSAYAQTATLTIRSRYGSPDPSVGTHTYTIDDWITASVATPVSGSPGIRYNCTGYRARGSPGTLPAEGSENSVYFQITMNTTITWRWSTQYQLTTAVSPEGSGTLEVSPTSPDGYYNAKTIVNVTAIENEGYDFSYWTGGLRGVDNPEDLLLRGPRTVTGNYILEKRSFTVAVASPECEPDPEPGVYEHNYGTTVNASCGPNPYPPEATGTKYLCTGHVGTGDISNGPETSISFTIYHDSTVTWTWQTWYQLTTSVLPEGSGTITCDPVGSGDPWYIGDPPTVVSLTATANPPYVFDYWNSDPGDIENPKSITMDSAKTVVANFTGEPILAVYNPSGYDTPDPAVGTYTYDPGTEVTCSMTTASVPAVVGETQALTYSSLSSYDPDPDPGWEDNYGFVFTPTINITMTKVMTIRGNGTVPVTIWDNATQTLLRQVDVPGCYVGVWTEADVVPPLELTAGTTYRIATFFNTDNTYYYTNYAFDTTVRTADVTLVGGCVGWGDDPVFPFYSLGSSVRGVCSFKYVKSRYFCTGYTGTGDCPSGSGTSVTFTINSPSSITWNWVLRHHLLKTVSPTAGISGWTTGGNASWAATTGDKHSGTCSARSGSIGDTQTSYIQRAFYVPAGGGTVTFWWKVSSQSGGDYLKFYIDSSQMASISGEVGWETQTFSLSAGTRTIKWEYAKNDSVSSGSDRGWIDDIEVTSSGAFTFTEGFEAGGTIETSPADIGGCFDDGTVVSVTAVPNTGYYLKNWSEDLTGTANPQDLTMNLPKRVTATFARPKLIVSNPGGYDWPAPGAGTYTYDYGTEITCSVTSPALYLTEGFEVGNISGWTTGYLGGSPRYWTASTSAKRTGDWGASAGIPSTFGATCYIERDFTIGSGGGKLSWWWRWSRGADTNYMRMKIDGVQYTQTNTSSTSWLNVANVALTEGTHTLRWELYRAVTAPNYMYLDDITITNCAPQDTRVACTGYTGTGSCPSGSETSVTFTIEQDSSITWNWGTPQYKLMTGVIPEGWGTVTRSPDPTDGWYDQGTVVDLTATPTDYSFLYWSGSAVTNPDDPETPETVQITMNTKKNVIANFGTTVEVASLYGEPDPPVGSTAYVGNSSVTVSCGPTPYSGGTGIQYVCTGWEGGTGDIPATGGATTCTFTITQPCTITWTWKTQYYLTTIVSPEGRGTITCAPAGPWHDSGTLVALTAVDLDIAGEGYDFASWSGDTVTDPDPETPETVEITMGGPKSVTANFIATQQPFTVYSAYGTPNPDVGLHEYDYDTSVTATGDPAAYPGGVGEQYVCVGYTGTGSCPSGSELSVTFTILDDSTIIWTWQLQYKLTTVVDPPGYGTVDPAGETWHFAGSVVTVTAGGIIPYSFTNWSGDLTGSENPTTITMNSPKSVTAHFGRPTLIVYNPDGYDTPDPAVGTHTYDAGTEVTCSIDPPSLPPQYEEGFESGTMSGWTTGGSSNWFVSTDDKHSGTYSVQSGALSNGQSNYIEKTFNFGAGDTLYLDFYWKASSLSSNNQLRFYIDGELQTSISDTGGEWEFVSQSFAGGTKTLKWECYRGDSDYSITGYIDDISIKGETEAVTYSPNPSYYRDDANYGFIFTAKSPIVITKVMTNRGSGTVPVSIWEDVYDGFESGSISGWTTGGDSDWYWYATTDDKYRGLYCAQSGTLSYGESNYIEKTLTLDGNGNLRFYWKASSESTSNELRFYIDGELQTSISDEGWDDVSYSLGSGTKTLKWECYRGDSEHSITGYIDDIRIWGAGVLLRTIEVTGASRGNWTEADVVPPLELAAGQTCRIATYFNENDTMYFSWDDMAWNIQKSPDISVDEACCSDTGNLYPRYYMHYLRGQVNFKYVKTRNLTYTGTGSCPSGAGSSITFTIMMPSTITWNYGEQHPLVTTVRTSSWGVPGYGIVEHSPLGLGRTVVIVTNSGVANEIYGARIESAFFEPGTEVTVTAVPSAAYVLDSWSEDLTGNTNPETIIMDAPKRVTATFAKPKLIVANPAGYDTPVPAKGTYTYDRGTEITCSITSPVTGTGFQRTCTGYDGTGSCPTGSWTGDPVVFTIEAHSSITWNWFSQYQLTVSVDPPEAGTVACSPDPQEPPWYDQDTEVELTASPIGEYVFSHWSGGATGSENPKTITMNSVKNITANFVGTPRAVVVTSLEGEPNPPAGTTYYANGTSVTLSCGTTPYPPAAVGTRYVCTGYTGGSGDITPSEDTVTSYGPFTITQACAITWEWKTQYYLATSVVPIFPVVGGTVTPSFGWYDATTVVDLEASATTGFEFSSWSGDPVNNPDAPDTPETVQVTMNAPKNVTAVFSVVNVRTVTVSSAQGAPDPGVGPTSCPYGYTVPLSAGVTPYPPDAVGTRYVCTGWSGGTGNIPATGGVSTYTISSITLDSEITWEWQTQYQLTTAVSPDGSGSVAPASGSWHNAGTVSCTATPNAGWGFVNWSGALSGTQNPKDLTMNGPKSITANFFKPTLTVYNPTGHDTPSPEAGIHTFDYNSYITCSVASPEFEPVLGTFEETFEGGLQSWAFGSDTKWFQTWGEGNKHSGNYSARSGHIYDGGSTYIQRSWNIDTGGGRVSFWWKVSSQSGCDFLRFYVDDAQQDAISGAVDWEYREFTVSAGTHTFKWVYTKDSLGAGGDDCGWLDDIEVTNILFTDGFESGISGWSFSGDWAWTATDLESNSGTYSARSGGCYPEDSSGIRRSFNIASEGGTVSFQWKVSSESGSDYLKFYIDDVEQAAISGEVDWTPQSYALSAGVRTIKWVYLKDIPGSSGSDCGWIDDVVVTNTTSSDGIESGVGNWSTGGGTTHYPAWSITTTLGTEGFESGTLSGWETSGPTWSVTTGEVHSGTYSAKSGNLTSYQQESSIEKSFLIGTEGSVTFWWKNASSNCVLRFFMDDVQQAEISGTTAWASLTYPLSEGMRTLRWTERSQSSSPSGNGYVDDITFAGSSSAQSADIGDYADHPDFPPPGLYGVETNAYMKRDFVIGEGGGQVSFLWKVHSENNYDWLEFYIDGVRKDRISGEVDWQQKTYPLSAGVRTLKWRYLKDSCWSVGSDCGWVDNIVVTNVANYAGVNYLCTGYTGTGSCPAGGPENSVAFTITQNSSITWMWKTVYLLSVSVDPTGSGTVGLSPPPIAYNYYNVGQSVTLTATPTGGTGYQFGEWSGDLTGDNNPETLTMNGPKYVTARFTGQNIPSNLAGVADGPTAITWSWMSNSNDWQSIAAGVLRTVAATLADFHDNYSDVPETENCPRTGSGDDRLLFEALDDLPGTPDDQDCPTVDVSTADTYTITYTRLSSSTWTCTADTNLTILYDYYIDQTGVLRQAMSTETGDDAGDGCQANAGSAPAPDDVWFEVQDSGHVSVGTVYLNITSWQEIGLSENTQYTRHVHAVNAGVYSDPTNDASCYTLVHDATTGDFTVDAGTYTKTQTVLCKYGPYAKRYPIDIAYNYARCQMLYYGAQLGAYVGDWWDDEVGQNYIPGKITKIAFQRASGDADEVDNVELHMTHTDLKNLMSGWVESTGQLVYSGILSIPAGAAGTWYEIELTSPFYYNGSSNLLISFRHQDGYKEDTYTMWQTGLFNFNTMAHCGRCVAFASDVENPPTTSEEGDTPPYVRAKLPNIQFEIVMGCATITVIEPPNSTAGDTGVRIERATDSSFTSGLTVIQPYAAVYTKTDIPPLSGTTYYYRIRFCNGDAVPSAYSEGNSVFVPVP